LQLQIEPNLNLDAVPITDTSFWTKDLPEEYKDRDFSGQSYEFSTLICLIRIIILCFNFNSIKRLVMYQHVTHRLIMMYLQ
jgi:hypothetical protein